MCREEIVRWNATCKAMVTSRVLRIHTQVSLSQPGLRKKVQNNPCKRYNEWLECTY